MKQFADHLVDFRPSSRHKTIPLRHVIDIGTGYAYKEIA